MCLMNTEKVSGSFSSAPSGTTTAILAPFGMTTAILAPSGTTTAILAPSGTTTAASSLPLGASKDWFKDGAGNPIPNQIYDQTDPSDQYYEEVTFDIAEGISFTEKRHLIDISAEYLIPANYAPDLLDHIKKHLQPQPSKTKEPIVKSINPINVINLDAYGRKYNSGGGGRINNTNSNCWISCCLQIIYAIKDIRNFLLYSNRIASNTELAYIRDEIQQMEKGGIINIANYENIATYFVGIKQELNKEGSATSFMAYFYKYLKKLLKRLKSNKKKDMDEKTQHKYNLDFKYLENYGELLVYSYCFDTKIKRSTSEDTEEYHFYPGNGDIWNPFVSVDSMNKKSIAELYQYKISNDLTVCSGQRLIKTQLTLGEKTTFVHFYNERIRIKYPKIMHIVISPPIDTDENGNIILDTKITGTDTYPTYQNNLFTGINLFISVASPIKTHVLQYVLVGIICYQIDTRHYYSITLDRIDNSYNMHYIIYDDATIFRINPIHCRTNLFFPDIFSGPLYNNNYGTPYPHILVYLRFEDIDYTSQPFKNLE